MEIVLKYQYIFKREVTHSISAKQEGGEGAKRAEV
jgi:hypothetical protein